MPPDVFAPLTEWEEAYERHMDRAVQRQQEARDLEAWSSILNLVFYETRCPKQAKKISSLKQLEA